MTPAKATSPIAWQDIDLLKEWGTKVLILTLKKEWYDCIKSGFKKEEYRAMKPYYDARFMKKGTDEFKDFDLVVFTNGYGRSVPHMVVQLEGIRLDKGNPNWGAKEDEVYYVLELGGVVYAS